MFYSTDFNSVFLLANLKALARKPSDHVPILWESGDDSVKMKPRFKFENWWIREEGFQEIVLKSWMTPVNKDSFIDIWNEKIRRLRKPLKGWNINGDSFNIKGKIRLGW